MGREGEPATFRIETVRPGRSREPVAREDARRVADAIAATVRAGERDPDDFLVLFRRRKFMDIYAAELERRGIACEIAGGGAFGESEELADLMPLLEALADPDNPVPLVAALRGPLFGVDDEALYRFARAHGRFHFRSEPPPETDSRIRRAFELLRQAETLVETLPPAAAISRLVDRLGVTALAAAKELGDSRAGNLLKALAAARKFSAQGSSFAGVVRELQGLRAQELIEQMSVEPGRAGAVRLMTLHGAKGLEAPVVFLADPTSDPGKPRDYWIDRARDEGHFRVAKRFGEFGEQDIALPQGWADRKEKEKLFDEAEKVRLLYVGATRAKEALVVSIWRTATGRKASGSWAVLDPYLDRDLPRPALSAEAEARPPTPRLADALEASRRLRAQRRDRSGAATRAAATVTDLAHGEAGRPAWERRGRGMSWGRAVHRLLEGAMRDETLDLGAYAANLLAEEERPEVEREEIARLADAVRRSPLWERARKARRRLPEVPFALEVAREELGLAEGPERVLLHGAIDLAFEEEDGWVLIDYKSDAVTPENLEGLVAFYSPQVTLYRRNWEKLTGRPAKAALFFLDGSREVWLPHQAAAAGVGR
jgi:ATP-dependent helicase/nuclease subunit A